LTAWTRIKAVAVVGAALALCGCVVNAWGPDTNPDIVACWGYGFYPETPEFAACMKYVETERAKRAGHLSVPPAPNIVCQTRSSGTDCQVR
jgi:hypothetical protein